MLPVSARLDRDAGGRIFPERRDLTVATEFSDEGKSGKNTTERPAFQEMMDKIKSGNPDGVAYVLVFKLSRFGRNAADVLETWRS